MDAVTPPGQQGHYWYPPPPSSGEVHQSFPPNPPQFHHAAPQMSSGHFPPPPPPQYPHLQQQLRPPPPWIPPTGVSPPLGMHFPGPYPAAGPPLPPPHHPHGPIYAPAHHTPPPYSHPNQMPGNPPWHGAQGWNYSDPNFQFNNGEDWAAKARAWATANSTTEAHPAYGPPNNIFNEQYQHTGMSSLSSDAQNPRNSTPEEYLHGRVHSIQEQSHGSATSLDAGEGSTVEGSRAASSSVNMQEVPSSYSFFSGKNEATNMARLHVPSVSPHSREHSVEFPPNTEQPRVLKQTTPVQAAVPVPAPLFPHATPAAQFEPPSISGHPQIFGRIQKPNFQGHLGFDVGPHTPTSFHVDKGETVNLSERPKKAAVPNWLKDEIIKKQAAIVGSTQERPNGNSLSSAGQVHERVHQSEGNGTNVDSPSSRSTEEEEDEDDEDAERLAAINQEIKRILTEVLLKVTDELFEEIATKVLNEDEPEVDQTDAIKNKDSNSPLPVTQKTKVLVESVSNGADEARISSTGGAVLGLADYSSSSSDDDDDAEKIEKEEREIVGSGAEEEKREKEVPPAVSVENTEVSSATDGKMEGKESGFVSGNHSAKKDAMVEKPHMDSDGKSSIREDDHVHEEPSSHRNISKVHRGSKDHENALDDKKNKSKDRKERPRDDDGQKREKVKDKRKDRYRSSAKDSRDQKKRTTSPPSSRARVSAREDSYDISSGDEMIESSRKRRSQSKRESLSPLPSRSRRHVMRSPHSKHSQRRHSPYSHSESRRRRSRSRSSSPGHKRRSSHRR